MSTDCLKLINERADFSAESTFEPATLLVELADTNKRLDDVK